eukprot:gene3087-2069_t
MHQAVKAIKHANHSYRSQHIQLANKTLPYPLRITPSKPVRTNLHNRNTSETKFKCRNNYKHNLHHKPTNEHLSHQLQPTTSAYILKQQPLHCNHHYKSNLNAKHCPHHQQHLTNAQLTLQHNFLQVTHKSNPRYKHNKQLEPKYIKAAHCTEQLWNKLHVQNPNKPANNQTYAKLSAQLSNNPYHRKCRKPNYTILKQSAQISVSANPSRTTVSNNYVNKTVLTQLNRKLHTCKGKIHKDNHMRQQTPTRKPRKTLKHSIKYSKHNQLYPNNFKSADLKICTTNPRPQSYKPNVPVKHYRTKI